MDDPRAAGTVGPLGPLTARPGLGVGPREAAAIRRSLLDWYDERRRELPWRRDRDPYRVWVSEIMLQQTRVETVVPYYERWMGRFPTVRVLADAEPDKVLAAWTGLGYYRRARSLHQAARMVCDRHGGRVPSDVAALRALPGIGAYTAGAIASIVFDRPAPAVDGNARRVLVRLFDLADPTPAALEALAGALVRGPRPGDLNQAIMELGATVCVPGSPACATCPIERRCLARARGTVARRPARLGRREPPSYTVGTAVMIVGDNVLVARRPVEGLLGGMWEFPGAVAARRESPAAAAGRVCRALHERGRHGRTLRGTTLRGRPLTMVEHAYSHRRHLYHAIRFDLAGTFRAPSSSAEGTPPPAPPRVAGAAAWTGLAWPEIATLDELPMGAAQRRIARTLIDP